LIRRSHDPSRIFVPCLPLHSVDQMHHQLIATRYIPFSINKRAICLSSVFHSFSVRAIENRNVNAIHDAYEGFIPMETGIGMFIVT